MDHDKWIGAGVRMGFSGSELQEYVEKRENEIFDREESRREDEKSRLEFERLKLEEESLDKQPSLKCKEQEREMELL